MCAENGFGKIHVYYCQATDGKTGSALVLKISYAKKNVMAWQNSPCFHISAQRMCHSQIPIDPTDTQRSNTVIVHDNCSGEEAHAYWDLKLLYFPFKSIQFYLKSLKINSKLKLPSLFGMLLYNPVTIIGIYQV